MTIRRENRTPGEDAAWLFAGPHSEPLWHIMGGAMRNMPRPAPTVESLALRLDALEREVYELRQQRIGARLRRGWSFLWSRLWGVR